MSRLALSALLVVGAFLGAAVSGVLRDVRSTAGPASAVLITPARSQTSVAANPAAATQLAATYAQVLAHDATVMRAVARATSGTGRSTRRHLGVTSTTSSAVVNLTYTAVDASSAKAALQAVIDLVKLPSGTIDNVDPGTVSVVARPSMDGRTPAGLHIARASLLVAGPSGSGGDALSANRLAANYVGLISEDSDVINYAAKKVGWRPGDLRDRLRVTNDPNTSLVRVSVSSNDYAESRAAVRAIVDAVSGARPITPKVAPSTLEVARLPEAGAVAGSSLLTTIVLGAILGLILAAAVGWAANRRSPRLRSPDALRDLFGVPALGLDDWTPQVGRSLVSRWIEAGASDITLISSAAPTDAFAEVLAHSLSIVAGDDTARVRIAFRSHSDAWEPSVGWGGRPSYGVLIVRRGQAARPLFENVAHLAAKGGAVEWCVISAGAEAEARFIASQAAEREIHPDPTFARVQDG